MQADDGYDRHADKHAGQHDRDDPGSPVCGLGRRLGDSRCVDEGVGEEEKELHVLYNDRPDGSVARLPVTTVLLNPEWGAGRIY